MAVNFLYSPRVRPPPQCDRSQLHHPHIHGGVDHSTICAAPVVQPLTDDERAILDGPEVDPDAQTSIRVYHAPERTYLQAIGPVGVIQKDLDDQALDRLITDLLKIRMKRHDSPQG